MRYINQYIPGIAPGIFPNDDKPEFMVSPIEDISFNDGEVFFLRRNQYGVIKEHGYRVNITESSGYLYFTEKEFFKYFEP